MRTMCDRDEDERTRNESGSGPTRHRSPISAPLTSSPEVVMFSPNTPPGSSRPSSVAQVSSSSRAYAYMAW